jgi:uncharacterized membrane protein YheB (UPF0754 family)
MEAFFSWLFHGILRPTFWFQPLFYALHGWLATEMAIWMLFHPYKAKYIPGTDIQLPLTPGIFPRGRANLSRSIADTVTRTLLTEADIHRQAEKLVTEENLLRCIEGVLDSIERELRMPEQLRSIYRYGEEVIPDLLNQLTGSLIDNLESGKSTHLQALLPEIMDRALSSTRLSYDQGEFLANAIFDTLLTPAYLRQVLVEGLSDTNIMRIDKGLSEQVGGLKGLLMRFAGIDKGLLKLRDYLDTEPAEAESRITELLDQLEIREKLAERISNFSFEALPTETREALLAYATGILTETLVDHRQEIGEAVSRWSGRASRMMINRILQVDLRAWLNEKRPDLKLELARFLKRYLDRELDLIVRRMLPAIDIGQMILEKLDQFSNEQLEQMIYGICRRELRWMAFLGAFLGFWLGLVSNVINYWLQEIK